MATARGVEAALKLLATNFAGEVTVEKVKVWGAALGDVTDEQLGAAIPHIIKTHTGDFIPPVGVIREACGANDHAAIDTANVIRSIERLGAPQFVDGFSEQTGWVMPRVERVREALGDAVANAYGAVGGGARLFCDDETGRTIAERDFMLALRSETAAEERRALPSERKPQRIAAGEWTP